MLVPVETVPNSLRVVACPRPFSIERVDRIVEAGLSVAEIMRETGINPDRVQARVFLDDRFIERAYWERVRPKPGHVVTVRVIPSGGGGGGGGKDTLGVLLTIAAVLVPPVGVYLALTEYAGLNPGLAGTLVFGYGGAFANLIHNALIPPPSPNLTPIAGSTSNSNQQESNTYALTGSSNQLLPYGVIPRVLGRHKIFPPLAAKSYTELVGDDQFYRLLFTCGYGPLALSDFQIGTTPLAQFTGVETEVRQGYPGDAALTLFSNTILEDALSIALTAANGWQVRQSRADANELSVDITCHQGLIEFKDDGSQAARTVAVDVGYQLVGAGSWTAAGTISVTATKSSQVRRGLRWTVGVAGTYAIRLRRTTADSTDVKIRDQVYWTTLRTIISVAPVSKTGLALVAMRIKATDQLNGVVDQFNCIAQSILPDWNGSSWVEQTTNNPASIYRAVLQGTANARALPDSRVDLTALQAWHGRCAAAGRTFNGVIDTQTTVLALLRQIGAIGRASWNMRDGKYSVVEDLAQALRVQVFTPRNSWGYQGMKAFLDQPHGFKVKFINPDAGWQQDEQIVYDDGYSAANASKFESLQFIPGCTDSDLVWKLGRYHIADARLRPESHTLWTDVENLVCTRGDLVAVQHDVILVGLAAGRSKAVIEDGGGNVTGITVDEALAMEAGKTYGVRIRRGDGLHLVLPLVTVAGAQTTVTFATAIVPNDPTTPTNVPEVGDLITFGLSGSESIDCLVKLIEPGPDLTAKLTLVDYAPAIQTADQGTIPAFSSQITTPTKLAQQQPPAPIVDAVRSDEEVLVRAIDGALESRIVISCHFASGASIAAAGLQVRYRQTGSTDPWQQLAAPLGADMTEISVRPVQDGYTYDIMLRSVSDNPSPGLTSDWVTINAHTVIGKTSPPPNITTLVLEGRWLRWTYPNPPLDFAGFRVREQAGANATWSTAQPSHDNLLTGTSFLIALKGGVRTYLVKAVDVAGNESTSAAVVSHDFGVLSLATEFGDTIPTNLILSTDLKAAGFPGTVTNGAIVGGNLAANDNGALFWTGDAAPFWSQDNATFWTVLYLEMTYAFSLIPDRDKLDAILSLLDTIAADSYTIDYHPDAQSFFWTNDAAPFWSQDSDLFWSGTVPDYLSWPGVLQPLSRQTYNFRIKTASGQTQGLISALAAQFDVLDIEETLPNITIGAAGTRLPITKSYREIVDVHLTLVDDLGVAESAKVYDYQTTVGAGPLVKCKDGTSTLTTGLVNARVKGY